MKPLKFIVFVLIALFVASCNKSQDEGSGVGDAIIVAKKSGINTVYGYALYAYSFSPFQSVKATSDVEANKIFTLKINQGYKTNFYYETPDAEFTTTKPGASTFNFSAVFENGVTDEFQDNLSDKVLAIPTINKAEYNSTTSELGITWTSVTDANSYAINILDGSTVVFGSVALAPTVKAYSISANGGGWLTGFTPVSGKTYQVKVLAFLLEPGAAPVLGSYANSYDVQAASVAETSVIWGSN